MTAVQRQYLAMYEQGRNVAEIARLFGKSKSTISRVLRLARATGGRVCPYSPSCFTCPLEDCQVTGKDVNLLPVGFNYTKFMESCGQA